MNATTTATDYAQPWWTRNDATYLIVYYARTIARIWRAYSEVRPGANDRTVSY